MRRGPWIPILFVASMLQGPATASSPLQGVAQIGSPGEHNCALVSDGVRCWGPNHFGVLGIGSNYNGSFLAPAVPALPSGVTAISAGSGHSCAIAAGGAASCWGWNLMGQLGTGSPYDSYVPTSVVGLGAGIRQI